jgi:hypothetical protein
MCRFLDLKQESAHLCQIFYGTVVQLKLGVRNYAFFESSASLTGVNT